MVYNQHALDELLSREVHLPIDFEPGAPPPCREPYQPLFDLKNTELRFLKRDLLHAIGCKTANLTMNDGEEAVQCAYLYTKVLDLRRTDIGFSKVHVNDSDLLSNRSHEIGVGVACLLAWKAWGFPWDQMEPIPGRGKRFDFRANKNGLTAIFEAKGASSLSTHRKQIEHGLTKKAEHRRRGDNAKIELIIATRLADYGEGSRITVADPPMPIPEWTFTSFGDEFFSLRHWARVLNFIGDTKTSRYFYESSATMIREVASWNRRYRHEHTRGLESIYADGEQFLGTWHRGVISAESDRPWRSRAVTEKQRRARSVVERVNSYGPSIAVFQGLNARVLDTLWENQIPSNDESDGRRIQHPRTEGGEVASVFPDGTILAVRYDD